MMAKIFFLLSVFASVTWAQDQPQGGDGVHRLGTVITGNQEQPKVLYIVPWKNAGNPVAISYQPIRGQTDNLFDHLEPREHRRHLEFLRELAMPRTN